MLEDSARAYAQCDDRKAAVWAQIARNYAAFGSPLVPSREDICIVENAVAAHLSTISADGNRAVMLGVTPGIARMQWPLGTRVVAVDNCAAVINALWPVDLPTAWTAVCADWLTIPVERRSCDVVVGDGSLNVCRFPGEVQGLCRALQDLLKDEGIFVVRCYVRPQYPETLDAVMAALFGERGLEVDAFKMRLWMAMQCNARKGVAVSDAADVLTRFGIDSKMMRERFGWSSAAIEPFSLWHASDVVYSFPTLRELRAVMSVCFDELSVTYPGYELGHCCPTVVMRPRRSRTE